MADEIRRNIKSGEQGQQSRDEAMKKFQSDGKINISGQEFSNFGDVQKFCQENGQACLAEGAKQGFVPKEFAAQKFEQSVNIQGDFEQHNSQQQFQNFQQGQFPGQNPQGGFPGQGGQYGNPQGQPYQPQPGQSQGQGGPTFKQGTQPQGFGEGFDKAKALEQFQKFLEDPSKNPMPSFQMMGPTQNFDNQQQQNQGNQPQGQFPGQNPQGGFPGQGNQYGAPEGRPYQQEGQFNMMPPQPYQSQENGVQPPFYGGDMIKDKILPDDRNFPCPAVMPRVCSPGEQARFTGGRCQPYSCELDRNSPPQPIDSMPPGTYPGGSQVSHTWRLADGSQSSQILSRTDGEYQAFIKGVDEQCLKITKDKFAWKQGAGDSSSSNWQNFGIPDCSGSAKQTTDVSSAESGCTSSGGTWDRIANYCKMSGSTGGNCASGQWWDFSSKSCKTTSTTKCESGQYWDGTACVKSSTNCGGAGYYWNGSSCQTTCASGQYWTGARCESSAGTGAANCTSGQYWDGSSQTCKSSTTATTCPSGQYLKDNVCVATSPTDVPPPSDSAKAGCTQAGGTWDTVSNYCKMPNANSCTASQFWSGTACVEKVDPALACPKAGGVWDVTTFYCRMPGQTASCTGGQSWDPASQTCKSPVTTTTTVSGSSCTSSQYWNGTACVAGTSQTCPSGQYVNGACSYGGSSTVGTSCTTGQYWNGTSCVTSTSGSTYSSDPATGCSQAGGTWSASSNYCQMPGQTMPSSGSYTMPSSGSYVMPSSGSYTMPAGEGSYTMPSSGSYTPPSGGSYTMPSGGAMMPPPGATLFDAVKNFFINLFK